MAKQCDRCGGEFKGFGTTCAECRKAPAPKGSQGPADKENACAICGKTVYVMEKLEIEGMLLHADCFRCAKCSGKLSSAKFARTPAGVFYCPTHYKELFTLRGKYDEDATKIGVSNAEGRATSSPSRGTQKQSTVAEDAEGKRASSIHQALDDSTGTGNMNVAVGGVGEPEVTPPGEDLDQLGAE